jgi:formate dehydrogenase subunit beta
MTTWMQIPGCEEGALAALRRLLADLLQKGLVEALLVPRPAPGGGNLVQALVERPEALADADPVAPVMPVQSARILSALTAGGAPYRLGAVLKSCEVRAAVELAKLKQVDLAGIVLIGIDCLGTYELPDYAALLEAGEDPTAHALRAAAEGMVSPIEGAGLRPACRMCEQPIPQGCALSVALLGTGGQVLVSGQPELVGALGYDEAAPPPAREAALSALVAERIEVRDRALGEVQARLHDTAGLLAEFGRCIRCHNCMTACPICYCRECIFESATFNHPPAAYQGWLRRHGALRLPADTLLFHLTRLNHMATSCVGCGVCSSACPSHLPVAEVFRAVGREVQALFDYAPGRSLDDELPLAVFREDELGGVAK